MASSTLLIYALASFLLCGFLLMKSYCFILLLLHLSLSFWSFSSAKLYVLHSLSSWSIRLWKKKIVPLKANAFITAPPIVNNKFHFSLPAALLRASKNGKQSNQASSHNQQKCNSSFFYDCAFTKHFWVIYRPYNISIYVWGLDWMHFCDSMCF